MDKLGLKCDPMTTADHQDAFRGFSTFLYVLVWGLVVVLYFNQNHLSYQSGCKRDKREPSYLLMSQILWRSVKYKTMPYLLFFDFVKIFFIEYGIVISQYPWEIASRTSPWIPKSTNAQVPFIKKHSTICSPVHGSTSSGSKSENVEDQLCKVFLCTFQSNSPNVDILPHLLSHSLSA